MVPWTFPEKGGDQGCETEWSTDQFRTWSEVEGEGKTYTSETGMLKGRGGKSDQNSDLSYVRSERNSIRKYHPLFLSYGSR